MGSELQEQAQEMLEGVMATPRRGQALAWAVHQGSTSPGTPGLHPGVKPPLLLALTATELDPSSPGSQLEWLWAMPEPLSLEWDAISPVFIVPKL